MDVLRARGAFTCKMGGRFGRGGGAGPVKKLGSADDGKRSAAQRNEVDRFISATLLNGGVGSEGG